MTGSTAIDKRALRILMVAHWRGRSRAEYPPTASDLEYARSAGYMFEPIHVSHDDIIAWLRRSRDTVALRTAADAFLASLTTRRLDWRSALGSLAYATCFPEHGSQHAPGWPNCTRCGAYDNAIAGEDLNILNFERWKWGGVRHTDPLFCAFDLQQFGSGPDNLPTPADIACLTAILNAAEALPGGLGPGSLVKAIAELLPSNANERRILVQILAMCGILACPGRPGYLEVFTEYRAVNSDRPSDHRNDWSYPAIWWRSGRQCIDRARVAQCFPAVAARLG